MTDIDAYPADASRGRVFDVVLADDDPLVREALAGLLSDHPALRMVGQVDAGPLAVELCAKVKPDLAIVDVMMPGGGCAAVTAIRAASAETVVVAYTARGDRRTREELEACGAAAVYVKGGRGDLAVALHELLERLLVAS